MKAKVNEIKLIDKSVLETEIKRRIDDELKIINKFTHSFYKYEITRCNARIALLKQLQEFLDTLEVKKVSLKTFPEPQESEDEQFKDQFKSAIAWLEKQGETSPVLSNSLNIGKRENKGNEGKISHKWSKEDEEEFIIAIETLHEAGQHSSAMWLKYEERKRWLCQQCGKPHQCGYVNRGLEDDCTALQEKMEGWELGYQDAIDNPTGGELLHVLNKGRKIGYKEAIDNACEFFKKNMWEDSSDDDTSYVVDGVSSSISEFIKNFIDYMEGQ